MRLALLAISRSDPTIAHHDQYLETVDLAVKVNTFPDHVQLQVLDELHTRGFKFMYEVGQQLSDCGDPIQARMRGFPGLCFNETDNLEWLKRRVELIKHHPALLGYYICVSAVRLAELLIPVD
eukprot:SAG31_NODE_14656_length_794_cov_1.181295_2_plen_123_part_00